MNKKAKLTFFVTLILIFSFVAASYSYNNQVKNYPTFSKINSSDRVLIFAPHPDDESLSSAGLIRYCVENNVSVHVVVVTNGGKGKIGGIRHSETLNATEQLGLSSANVTFLDYPQAVNHLFNENWDPNHSYSDGSHHNSFAYDPNSSYCGESLESNIETMIQDYKPTIIIYPRLDDDNSDHWGTGSFVDYAVNNMGYQAKMYSYLVHDDETLWPFPRSYYPQSTMLPPSYLKNQTNWLIFPLNNSLEQSKFNAVNCYQSQMKKDSVFLKSFVKANELFAVDPSINVTRQNTTNDYCKSDDFPRTVFHDPVDDILNPQDYQIYSVLDSQSNYDINQVGFEIDNNTLWVSIKTTGGISKAGAYQFHLRGFGDEGISRIDFQVQNGKTNYIMPSSNSLTPPLKLKDNNDGIVVGIPAMLDDHMFMIDVESENATQTLDRTGYFNVYVN
jgi:LmbE family N-acetylglucosaminyl deacetylase